MKWIGWALSAVLAIVCAVVYHSGNQQANAFQQDAEAQMQAQRDKVDVALTAASEGIPAKQERLAAETAKKDGLQAQLQDLEQKNSDLTGRLDHLSEDNDALRQRMEQTTDAHQENEEEIRQAQAKLATVERQIGLLRQAVRRVTPAAEL